MDSQAMLTRSAIEKCVKAYKHEKSFYFVVAQDVKPKQIESAIKRFAPDVRAEDVVALMDTTLFGSGKEGFLLTTTHMYGKYMEGKTIELNRFSRVTRRKEHYITVTYPDGKADTLYVSIYDQDLFNLLKLIMDESARLIQAEKDSKKAAADAAREFGNLVKVKLHEVGVTPAEEPKEEPEPKAKPEPRAPEDEPGIIPTPAFDPIDEPEDPAPQEDAEALFQEGRRKFMVKDYSAAVAAFQKAADMGHRQAAQFLKQLKAITGNNS